jgi:squalene-hopene/tetraprenyl-beta-curcumene cyclase
MKKISTSLIIILLILPTLAVFSLDAKAELKPTNVDQSNEGAQSSVMYHNSSVWERSRTSSDGHFVLYYNTTDPSTPASDNDVSDEYVQWVEDALVYSWNTLIDGYGFRTPPRTTLPPPLKHIIPVYIKEIPAYGIFYPDLSDIIEYLKELLFKDPKYSESTWYHIIIDADLPTRGLVNVTVAHEFFHAVQYSYSLFLFSKFNTWISEGLAVWAEDIVYDHVNDYTGWVNSFLSNPNRALTSLDYDAVLYWKFLGEKYGGIQNEKQVAVIKKVLEFTASELGLLTGGTRAVDKALKTIDESYSFDSSFIEWTIWNYFKQRYEEGDLYHEIFPRDVTIPKKFNQQKPIEKYASEYVNLKPPVPMTLAFDGDWLTNFAVRVLKIKGSLEEIDAVSLNWQKDGSLLISEAYDKIIFMVARLDDIFGDGTYTTTVSSLHDFYIMATAEQDLYKPGETTEVTVIVTNTRGVRTEFWLGVSFKDSSGEYTKYDPQISIRPTSATLDPGRSTSFSVTWTIPPDAPIGSYQIAVNCWKDPGFKQSYTDNLDWSFIFYVFKLNIRTPTSSAPAMAGDPTNPNEVLVLVEWIPRWLFLFMPPMFSIQIDNQYATYELTDTWNQLFGIYTLKVSPPAVPDEGLYDLSITATFAELTDSDTEENAIKYVTAPPAEPIQKGLAWLRTRQNADGSWQSNVGVTSLAVLAFLNAGYDETDITVSKAISYILSNVKSDGSIYVSYPTYETSLAILPLVATRNDAYKATIENARNWLIGAQQDETFGYTSNNYQYGGWTYGSYQGDPDLSNTQFALLALDAANLPKTDPTWSKAVIFIQRCQNRPESNDQAWAHDSSRPSYNDGGFIYRPWGWSLAGGTTSYGSMTGAGIWGLLLCGVPKTDERVVAAMNWVRSHYTWDTNPGIGWWRMYYYYLSMSKALTMYGQPLIDGHDWYQELYNKIVGMQIDAGSGKGYWSTSNEDDGPDLTTAYAILSLQTRAIAPPVQRLSYLTFILRSNCLLRITDPQGNAVGYNYLTGLGENQVPTAVYSGPFMEPQYIVIVNPGAGTYRLELIGISEGPYELTIQGNYGEEVTDTFTYQGEIKPSELHGTDVTVTAIVGPIDVYANPPEFQEIIDNIPPTTTLEIGEPKYADITGNIYVSSLTSLTLTAEDNPGGTGVASTFYRIYNSTYDTGWMEYSAPFYLIGLSDGEYSIDYYSIDNIGNVEPTNTATVILDNTPPTTTLTVGEPKYVSGITYVTPDTPLTLEAIDTGSGVYSSVYRIYNSTYDSGWMTYTGPFYLTSLTDGTYTIEYYSIDNVQNLEAAQAINVTLFSWNYIFEDTYGRGTTLKINLAHKFFQFITPDKDYGIRNATYMRQCGRAIIIQHCDKELRLITVAVDTKLDFCYAMAWDLQTRKCYLLIDKAGIE